MVLDPPLVGCLSIPDASGLHVTRPENGVTGLKQELYVLGNPWLVTGKHADPL